MMRQGNRLTGLINKATVSSNLDDYDGIGLSVSSHGEEYAINSICDPAEEEEIESYLTADTSEESLICVYLVFCAESEISLT